MFDFSVEKVALDVSDWSSQMLVDLDLSLQVNYFNIKNSHWEPIIEPWSCNLNITRSMEKTMAVSFTSRVKLEFNLSHVFIEIALKTLNRWNKQEEVCRYLIAAKAFFSSWSACTLYTRQ